MLTKRLFLWLGGLAILWIMLSCSGASGRGYTDATHKKQALLIIAEDRSGSTQDQRKLTAGKYKEILHAFVHKYCGQVAVRVIGNPAPGERNFYTLDLDCPQPYEKINKEDLLHEKARKQKHNKEVAQANKALEQRNLQAADAFVEKQIVPHVVQYKPYRNQDVTDIADAFRHIELKLNEPTFADFDVIEVLIISDGIHDAGRLERPLSLKMNRGKLYVVGWKDTGVFQGDVKPVKFESVDGFISYYKNH